VPDIVSSLFSFSDIAIPPSIMVLSVGTSYCYNNGINVRREVKMKPIKIENEEIRKVIISGEDYIQIDDRKFLLFEVDQIKEPNVYEVTDLDEESQLRKALEEDNPILS
jgi:hypothetical protein